MRAMNIVELNFCEQISSLFTSVSIMYWLINLDHLLVLKCQNDAGWFIRAVYCRFGAYYHLMKR